MADITTDTYSRSWLCLPTELKDMILERCTWNTRSEDDLLAGSHQLAMLATVCRDWEHFFGGKVFRRLTLKTEEDVQNFASIVQSRRRAYVEWVWLRIELPMYTCERCHRFDSHEEGRVERAIFTSLVWSLFDVLSKWKNKEVRKDGITLEFSAHSLSDAHHFNKDLRFRLHDTAWERWDDSPIPPHNDPFHGWKDGKHIKSIPRGARFRLLGFGLCFDYNSPSVRRLHMRLPKVSVATAFVIRRQFPRVIVAQKSLVPILRSLTRLSSFSFEPWQGPTSLYRMGQDGENAFLAKEALKGKRKTLKKISIFQSHDRIFYTASKDPSLSYYRRGRFSKALARTSHHLEELYVAKNIEAYQFFFAFRPQAPPKDRRWMKWKNLKKLSLTTRTLAPEYGDVLLQMAAEAAMAMPKLEVMELWNCWASRGTAAIFRFRRGETEASVEFTRTWSQGLRMSAATKEAWGRVATAHRPLPFRLEERTWNAGEIDGEYSVLSKLELVEHMLNPVSLMQIAREDQRRREERDA